jgi:cytochrome c oxidase subunit 4
MSIDHTVDAAGHADDSQAGETHAGHAGDHAHGLTDLGYVKVAVILALMTALEVGLSYAGLPGSVFMPALLILMAAKFWTVVSYFMHLKFDNPIFTKLFYSGLFLALGVFTAVLLTFRFFDKS